MKKCKKWKFCYFAVPASPGFYYEECQDYGICRFVHVAMTMARPLHENKRRRAVLQILWVGFAPTMQCLDSENVVYHMHESAISNTIFTLL